MDYEVIVIGGGHAGIEASLASARLGCKTLLVTLKKETIGRMSCNPAIGGVGKAQLVRELDALGGQMAKTTDVCAIQFRTLNASKGPAVQSLRAQVDMYKYEKYMQEILTKQENLFIKEAEVKKLIIKNNKIRGIITDKNEEIISLCIIICVGTFLEGLIHIGLNNYPGGRYQESSSMDLANSLKEIGFTLMRFKTGTCARIHKDSIDFSKLTLQEPDNNPQFFSFSTQKIKLPQVPCYITYTNESTHKIILENLNRSPLYTGIIKGTGVRYCPSIEDKVVKFKDKPKHQIFLEPQGLETDEVYLNGLSTSLPEDVQERIIHSIKGLEEARILRFGYGIEHTVVDARQIYPTLETKIVENLYLAGQINGTTGYEEAAVQGLIAGINASLKVKNKEPLILDRASSYIGVLIDDLTTKGTNEPYRMFTSRVEYRLILRQDNADLRLSSLGYRLGLISAEEYRRVENKRKLILEGIEFLRNRKLKPSEINPFLALYNSSQVNKSVSLEEILKRPHIHLKDLKDFIGDISLFEESILKEIETEIKYQGFIQRQNIQIEKFRNLEKIVLPPDLDYNKIPGLSREIQEKLTKFRPINLGQAARLSGITPSAITILMIYLKKINKDGRRE